MWKILLFVVYCLLCICVGLLISYVTPHECKSKECEKKSSLILHNINALVEPCDNFYGFVCGNYKKYGKERNSETSTWQELIDKQKLRLVEFLKRPDTKTDDRVLKTIRSIFKSCMDTNGIDNQGLKPLLNAFHLAGGFPLLEGNRWETNNAGQPWSMQDLEYTTRFAGFKGGHLFSAYIQNFRDAGKIFIHLEPPKYFEFRPRDFNPFFRYLKKISSILGSKSEDVDKEINDTLTLQYEISKLSSLGDNCTVIYRYVQESLKMFSDEFEYFNITEFVNNMIPDVVSLPETIVVIFNSREYFTKLKELVVATPKRIITNYMMLHNIMEVTTFLPTSLRNALAQLKREIKGIFLSEEDRRIVCIRSIKEKLASALSSLYLTNVVKRPSRNSHVSDIFPSFKKELKKVVDGLKWMNKNTKKEAKRKIEVMDFATPVSDSDFEVLTNRTAFRLYYEDLCFAGNQSGALLAFMTLEIFRTGKEWELVERDFVVFDKSVDIFSSDVEYDYTTNLVTVPMALLNFPTYNVYWPYYLNYGGFGTRIATELVRGIVSYLGSRYDKDGKWNKWWDDGAREKYKSYSTCVMNQFNEYIGKRSNSKVMDHECMEDYMELMAGVLVSFNSYKSYDAERFFGERHLPMLKQFSPQQLFFIDFATYFCNVNPRHYHQNMTQLEFVSGKRASEYKVLSSLKNLKEFNELFECSKSAKMNPQHRCEIWTKKDKGGK